MPIVTVTSAPYSLAYGELLSATNDTGVSIEERDGAAPDVSIGGAISVSFDSVVNTELAAVAVMGLTFNVFHLDITAQAQLSVTAVGDTRVAYGLMGGTFTPMITNAGAISVTSDYQAFGVQVGSYVGTTHKEVMLTNFGQVTVKAVDWAVGIRADGGFGQTIDNEGIVKVYADRSAVGFMALNHFTHLINGGRIEAADGGEGWSSVGVSLDGSAMDPSNSNNQIFVNTGVVQADIALKVDSQPSIQTASAILQNNGQLIGRVVLGAGHEILVNSGLIKGDVDLGGDNDTYDGRLGSTTGMVAGGDGADTLMGGAGFDYLQGNAGADSESGGAGDDWVVGGQGNDQLFGGDGADIVYANLGDDTLSGDAGDDWVRGGQGNDVLSGGAGNDFMSGDKGDDTISGGAGADIFHSWGDAGIDRVTDFSAAEGDRVQLDPGTTYRVSQSGADTVITMTGGAVMTLVGVKLSSLPSGWIFVG
ncbi:calcium-binding protein [Phenylobacterium aquaticum]|uniref:calcium-binding protein n=1 Tax=Phenylobacterium aquaticum TaxID=1763816 RepID=UPI001F5C2329|nr:calcium-binding protein [Phenylobacterium aquaticum]MCI3133672.1 hypothetical protein [Phenylobacterium aquaticum]